MCHIQYINIASYVCRYRQEGTEWDNVHPLLHTCLFAYFTLIYPCLPCIPIFTIVYPSYYHVYPCFAHVSYPC